MRRESNGDQATPTTRRDVVGVGVDRLEELQVVAHAEIQRDARADFPLVLHVDAEVRIRLRHLGDAERLGEAGVVVDAGQEVRQRRERVAPANRARIGDPVVVVEEVDADPERMGARPGATGC